VDNQLYAPFGWSGHLVFVLIGLENPMEGRIMEVAETALDTLSPHASVSVIILIRAFQPNSLRGFSHVSESATYTSSTLARQILKAWYKALEFVHAVDVH
jgi:hypothetical protein